MLSFEQKVRILFKGKQQIRETGFIEIAINNVITKIDNVKDFEGFTTTLINNKTLNDNNWWREGNFLYIK